MKLNEEETYNAHLWLLTVPRVGIVVELGIEVYSP